MPGMKPTMEEYTSGTLHSGSKTGPIVKSRAQAIAIGLHEKAKAGGDPPSDPPHKPMDPEAVNAFMGVQKQSKRGSSKGGPGSEHFGKLTRAHAAGNFGAAKTHALNYANALHAHLKGLSATNSVPAGSAAGGDTPATASTRGGNDNDGDEYGGTSDNAITNGYGFGNQTGTIKQASPSLGGVRARMAQALRKRGMNG